jgi:hypothetical protein
VKLRVEIAELDFPGEIEQIVAGSAAKAKCRLEVYDPANRELIGTAEIGVAEALPGVPIAPIAMAIRGVESLIVGAYTRKHVLDLVEKLSRESVKVLDEAKKR